MTVRALYIPAFDEAEARIIAESVARGETGELAYHTDRAEVDRICAYLNRDRGGPRYQTFAVEVSTTTTHDGRIKVARLVDRAGDIAAALLLVVGAPMLAAACWSVLA